MASISYSFKILAYINPLNTYTEDGQSSGAITALNNGGFFTTFESRIYGTPGYYYLPGRFLNASGVPTTPEILASRDFDSYRSEAATLTNGNVVVAYNIDPSSSVGFKIMSPSGSYVTSDTTGSGRNFNADVARLNDGGFVVSFDHQYSSSDIDTYATIYNADGSVRASLIVDARTYVSYDSAVAGLTNGNFVVTYAKETALGSGSYQLAFQIYNASGGLVRGETIADRFGSRNIPGEAIGLKDGGFAVVYTDNDWGTGSDDITLGIWNADGSFRTWLLANAPVGTAGAQHSPTVTQLDNGYIAVGWSSADSFGTDTEYSIWSPNGVLITSGTWQLSSSDLNFASAANGVLSGLTTDHLGDGDGFGITSATRALARYTYGDATAETLTGDSLRDYISGSSGNDTLSGLGGNDTLDGGAGTDRVDGGIGNDLIYGSAGA